MKCIHFIATIIGLHFVYAITAQKTIPLSGHLNLEECKASKYLSAIQYIPLETKSECLLNEDIEVIVTRTDIFIHDFKADNVFRFDINGTFLNKIGQKGQGPGEYKRLFGFYIDDIAKKCFLLDSYANRIHVYNYDGTFQQQFSGDYASSRMERIGNNYILNNELYIDTKKELFLLDNNGNLLKQGRLNTNFNPGFMLWAPFFYKHGGHCYYKNYVSDNIYRIDEKAEKQAIYRIDCGNKAINPKENQYDIKKGSLVENKIIVGTIKGYKDNLYITYCTDKRYFAVYDINTEKVFSPGRNRESGFTDDLTGGPFVTIPYSSLLYDSCVEGQLVSVLHCSDISVYEPYKNGSFGKTLKLVNEDSNPIIRIATLK